jgi:hypothetical protein
MEKLTIGSIWISKEKENDHVVVTDIKDLSIHFKSYNGISNSMREHILVRGEFLHYFKAYNGESKIRPEKDQVWYSKNIDKYIKIFKVENEHIHFLEKEKDNFSFKKSSIGYYKKSEFLEWFNFYYRDEIINDVINFKEEARQAYRDQQSQDNEGGCGDSIGFIYGYVEACKRYKIAMDDIKKELDQTKELIALVKELINK